MAAAAAIAIAFALPLRNIANVKPEIVNVLATEERTVAVYREASDCLCARAPDRRRAGPARRAHHPV